ncbi:hypothetical protein GWI33_004306 [Rhynchophorus ferrugineus]|uniref:Uncharacterized protein n=1 Tax=Rhynchophorus ferrugineus TaxID=354439 RepID=A0A834IIU6_RHYFE|nr:hypothetical protein GWI33_004306 [Rhynchophorus ferrugineus]
MFLYIVSDRKGREKICKNERLTCSCRNQQARSTDDECTRENDVRKAKGKCTDRRRRVAENAASESGRTGDAADGRTNVSLRIAQ